ncbi:MAG: efflux RND transporter periplasmic adaptor subunit [Anaerolineae bacterium]
MTQMSKKSIWILPLLALILTSCAALDDAAGVINDGQPADLATAPLAASGFIEADEVSVVSETGGRVSEVLAAEADTVEEGQPLIVLDDSVMQAERAQALAAAAAARADLARLTAGASAEEIAAAQAALDEAQAAVEGARLTAGQAWQVVNNPADVDVQIAAAQTQVDLAWQQITLLQARLGQQEFLLGVLRSAENPDEHRIDNEELALEAIRAQLRAAEAEYNGAQRKLEALNAQRARPLTALAQARSAQAQIPVAEARAQIAQAQYDLLVNGPTPEEIAIAEAQVRLAEARVGLIDAQIDRLTLYAPAAGVITTRSISAGETASPGVPLMTIANLDVLRLVVYIQEPQIGRVQLGAKAAIRVDAYPGRRFEGVVVRIADEAEFTPRSVQTSEDRASLVFAVEITLENPDGLLKPGMPADVVIEG